MLNNLVLYNHEGEIKYLLNICNKKIENGIFSKELNYLELDNKLYEEIEELLQKNKLIIETLEDGRLYLKNIKIEAKAIVEKKINKEDLLAKALMETTLEQSKLKQEIAALSDAVLQMTLKK